MRKMEQWFVNYACAQNKNYDYEMKNKITVVYLDIKLIRISNNDRNIKL